MSKYSVTYSNGSKVQEEVLPLSPDNRPYFNGRPFGEFGLIANATNPDGSPAYPLGYRNETNMWQPLPKCEMVYWKPIEKKFSSIRSSGSPAGVYKNRLNFLYDDIKKTIRPDPKLNIQLGDYAKDTAVVNSMKILNMENQSTLKEGFHYTVTGNGYVWFVGSLPYKKLKVIFDWKDKNTQKNYISELQTETILDATTFGIKRAYTVYKSYFSPKSDKDFETIETISKLNRVPTVDGIKSINPLGPWTEPIIYVINGGECSIEIGLTGQKTYMNASGLPTTPEEIKNVLNIDLIHPDIDNFKTVIKQGKDSTGIFLTIEPDINLLNDAIKQNIEFTSNTGIKNISIKFKGNQFRKYWPWPGDKEDLSTEYKFLLDMRKKEPVPYRKCYDGYKTHYVISEEYEVIWQRKHPCYGSKINTPPVMQYSSSIEFMERTFVEWEEQTLNRGTTITVGANQTTQNKCGCLEVEIIKEPTEIEEIGCGCKRHTEADYYLVCPDEVSSEYFKIFSAGDMGDGTTSVKVIPDGMNPIRTKRLKTEPCRTKIPNRDNFTYHKFDESSIITGQIKSTIAGLFNTSESIDCYTTSSLNTGSNQYYYDIHGCEEYCDNPYFAVSYGHNKGSGSLYDDNTEHYTGTKSIYTQYRLKALEMPTTQFSFYNNGSTVTPDDIYIVNFYRNRFRNSIDAGNFQISLSQLSGSHYSNNVHTGSNVKVAGTSPNILTFVDNSQYSENEYCFEDPNSYFDIVSGSLIDGIHDSGTGSITTNPNITTYGKFYPALGIVVFNGSEVNNSLSFNSVTGSNIHGDNSWKLYTSISGAAALGYSMKGRNRDEIGVKHYFVRVPFDEANYTTNPSYNSGSNREMKYRCMVNDPITYITTVGLYNDNNELLALAKMNKPIKKSMENDILIHIKLANT